MRTGLGLVWAGAAAVVAWVAGVALLNLHPQLPSRSILLAECIGAVALALVPGVGRLMPWLAARRRRSAPPQPLPFADPATMPVSLVPAAFAAALLLGHACGGLRTLDRLEQRLPHALEGVALLVVGTVEELPRRSPQGVQFVLRVESAHGPDGQPALGVPHRLWLGWWVEGHVEAALAAPIPEPLPGQRWQLPVSLRRPHGTLNPGAFDAERWFLEQDLGAAGSVPASRRAQAMLLAPATAVWRQPEAWRAVLRARIDQQVPDAALAGLVAGLTIGDQSAVDQADWRLFRDAGVAHVLSISGLHVTAFAALMAPLATALWKRWPAACMYWPAPLAGAWAGWACAALYALLAGWGLPAQRTVAMLGVWTLVRTAGLNWPPVAVWLAAAAPVVVWDPWAVSQAGFWLSFAAVGLLLLSDSTGAHRGDAAALDSAAVPGPGAVPGSRVDAGAPVRPGLHHAVGRGLIRALQAAGQALRTQFITAVGLAPLAAACFQQLSVMGVVANLLAVPWITLVLTPVSLLGLVVPPLWGALPWLVDPLRAVLAELTDFPWAVVTVPAAHPLVLALALLGAVLALMPLPMRLRLCGAALMLPLMLPAPHRLAMGRLEVWALDVGQGSAVLVRTRGHALLIDAGPAWGEDRDAGERTVLPVLRSLGVRALDLLVITHRDIDHAGGAASVLRGLPVRALLASLEPTHPLRRMPLPQHACRRGQHWVWDGVRFDVLHPFGDEAPRTKANAISCVLRIEDAQGRSVLVAADIEHAQEAALVERDRLAPQPAVVLAPSAGNASPAGSPLGVVPAIPALRSDVLVVPHHGSRTSSTGIFLQAVQPTWAIAQAGHRNRHGHPAPVVVDRYAQHGVPLAVSPWCGAWRWDGQGDPQCWRQTAPRHWHDQPR